MTFTPPGRLALLALGALAVLTLAPSLHAHQTKLSSSRLLPAEGGAQASLEINAADLNTATGLTLTGAGGQADAAQLSRHAARVIEYVRVRVALKTEPGPPCTLAAGEPRASADHVLLTLDFRCAPTARTLSYRVTLFHDIDPAARHMVAVDGPERRIGLLGTSASELRVSGPPPGLWRALWHYFVLGTEHIAIGWDHIAFLIATIALARSFGTLVVLVSAFTVAHSITLALAVLGLAHLPARPVEVAIAASIVYVAAENFFVRRTGHRWLLTFAFGLVHGFGFASVLRDYGIPEETLAAALAAFNVGVEAGQLAIVGAAALLWRAAIAAARSTPADQMLQRRMSHAVSALVLVPGIYWFCERLLAGY